MEGEVIDPLELSKHPKLIKDAQEEIKKLDVLVCGECHDVFHYIEPFQEHREKGKCTGISVVRENYKHEPKAQVWAFMLWKNAQFKRAKEAERRGESMPTSWQIYQRWCKLSLDEKDAWISAGQTIQSFTKISAAKVQEIKTEIKMKAQTSPAIATVKNKLPNKPVTQTINKKDVDDDPLEEGEIRLSQLTNAQRVAIKAQVATNKANAEVDPLADVGDSEMDTEEEVEKAKKVGDVSKKTAFNKPVQLNNDLNKSDSRKAMRTSKNEQTEETAVERILSRRFSHKKKCMEYFIKWENLNETENTWEPKQNLEKCKKLIEDFDKVFNKPKLIPKLPKRIEESHSEHSETEEVATGRPQRTSKQKALNQVKAWCGDITEADEASGKRKSFSDDDDSSDSFEKKIKLEEETDSSEDEKPSLTIRRIVKAANSVNGVTKKPSEGSLPTTQRVVRVSQKQLPTLSSGVYIMSKTEGIIKLDSNTPAAGNPLLRVGPKIGQTHIKVVKKDGSTSSNVRAPVKTISKLGKNTDSKPSTSTPKSLTKVLSQRRASSTSSPKPPIRIIESNTGEKIVEKVDFKKSKAADEDSDGLEELEFPTDLPMPAPESPPGEFTLCPLTGKILGQDDENIEQDAGGITENTSLDHLVKEAVAEMSDIDMDTNTSEAKDEYDNKISGTASIGSVPSISTPPPLASLSTTHVVSVSSSAVVSSTPAIITPTTVTTATPVKIAPTAPVSVTPSTKVGVTSILMPIGAKTITGGHTSTPITRPVFSETKVVRTQQDIEEDLKPMTIVKEKPKEEGLIRKPKAISSGTSILNAALTTTKAAPSPSHMGPPKKLLTTPPIRTKLTTTIQQRPPINRPSVHRPSPTTTIIHKISPSRNRPAMSKTIVQQEPVLKRSSNVTTYKPANVARRIGNTTIYKTSEKPARPPVKKPTSTSLVTTVATITQPTLIQTSPTVINMPLLTTDEEPVAAPDTVTVAPLNEIETLSGLTADSGLADLATFSLPESDTPLLITGDDGTIYQVAGQNEEGQTILISEGPDGQQQCVLVASDPTSEETQTLMMDNAATEPEELEQALMINTQLEETEGDGGDAEESQVVAQIIKADPPSPGGTRKVVLMLPDGNLMMTDVSAEQYAALDLDK